MLKTLKKAFEIDITVAFNSFVYTLQNNKLLKNIFKGNLYKNKGLKLLVRILAFIFSLFRLVLFRYIYFALIIYILYLVKELNYFKEVFLLFSVIGMFINTNTLRRSVKKYYNVILLGMDPINYTKANIIYTLLRDFILNFLIMLSLFSLIKLNLITCLLISLISSLLKVVGEYINILYYKKYNNTILNNFALFWIVIISILIIGTVIYLLEFRFSLLFLIITTIIIFILALISYGLISKEEKIRRFYRKINNESVIVQEENALSTRQLAVEISKKDYIVDPKKLKGKEGYNYFNTIFFERHKRILNRSAYYFTFFITILVIGVIIVLSLTNNYDKQIGNTIIRGLPSLLFIMYFINRGSIITEAMFINCDHFMLTFNFYREPKVILNLFKERLKIVTKVNLLPALALGIGLILSLIFSTNPLNIIEYILLFISVIAISVFFSVHYLVIYYLLQPYDVNLKMRSFSYGIVSFLTYFICYRIMQYRFAPFNFSVMIIIATITYIVIALILVYKKASYTFKLK